MERLKLGIQKGFERSKKGIERGIERYSPYVKRFGKRVGEMMKEAPEKISSMAKYTTSKIGSISDKIDEVASSPFGEFVISQIGDPGLVNDVEQIRNLNRFVGGVSKGSNKMLEGKYMEGLNSGVEAYKKYEKDTDASEDKYNKSVRERSGQARNDRKNRRGRRQNEQ